MGEEIPFYKLGNPLTIGYALYAITEREDTFSSTIEQIARGEKEVDIRDITLIMGRFQEPINYSNLSFLIPKEPIPKSQSKLESIPLERILEAFRGYYYTGISKLVDTLGSSYGVINIDLKMSIYLDTTQFKIPKTGDIFKKDENGAITGIYTENGIIDIKTITDNYIKKHPESLLLPRLLMGIITIGIISKYPITKIPSQVYD
jgi:hypothetical protein